MGGGVIMCQPVHSEKLLLHVNESYLLVGLLKRRKG